LGVCFISELRDLSCEQDRHTARINYDQARALFTFTIPLHLTFRILYLSLSRHGMYSHCHCPHSLVFVLSFARIVASMHVSSLPISCSLFLRLRHLLLYYLPSFHRHLVLSCAGALTVNGFPPPHLLCSSSPHGLNFAFVRFYPRLRLISPHHWHIAYISNPPSLFPSLFRFLPLYLCMLHPSPHNNLSTTYFHSHNQH
jgi:hypothetical protein